MALLNKLRSPNPIIWRYHPHETDQPILRVSQLSAHYENRAALDELSFELQQGERLAVVGPNGAGKSTLFKIIAGIQNPSRGQVHIYGHAPGGHICIAYVPQRSLVDWSFPVSVADVVMMGRIGKLGLLRWPKTRDWDYVHHALKIVGMAHLADRQINELSGGQQQRMFIARALAQEAELMLMDEPLTGLDVNSVNDIFEVLNTLRNQNVTVMIALHDLKMAADRFDRVMLLNHRLIGLGAPESVFSPENLLAAYGGHLQLVPTGGRMLALGDTCCDEGEHPHG